MDRRLWRGGSLWIEWTPQGHVEMIHVSVYDDEGEILQVEVIERQRYDTVWDLLERTVRAVRRSLPVEC